MSQNMFHIVPMIIHSCNSANLINNHALPTHNFQFSLFLKVFCFLRYFHFSFLSFFFLPNFSLRASQNSYTSDCTLSWLGNTSIKSISSSPLSSAFYSCRAWMKYRQLFCQNETWMTSSSILSGPYSTSNYMWADFKSLLCTFLSEFWSYQLPTDNPLFLLAEF